MDILQEFGQDRHGGGWDRGAVVHPWLIYWKKLANFVGVPEGKRMRSRSLAAELVYNYMSGGGQIGHGAEFWLWSLTFVLT